MACLYLLHRNNLLKKVRSRKQWVIKRMTAKSAVLNYQKAVYFTANVQFLAHHAFAGIMLIPEG